MNRPKRIRELVGGEQATERVPPIQPSTRLWRSALESSTPCEPQRMTDSQTNCWTLPSAVTRTYKFKLERQGRELGAARGGKLAARYHHTATHHSSTAGGQIAGVNGIRSGQRFRSITRHRGNTWRAAPKTRGRERMIEVTVNTTALSKLIADLAEGFDDEVVEAMAEEILEGADERVPVDTGKLKESRTRRGTSRRDGRRSLWRAEGEARGGCS